MTNFLTLACTAALEDSKNGHLAEKVETIDSCSSLINAAQRAEGYTVTVGGNIENGQTFTYTASLGLREVTYNGDQEVTIPIFQITESEITLESFGQSLISLANETSHAHVDIITGTTSSDSSSNSMTNQDPIDDIPQELCRRASQFLLKEEKNEPSSLQVPIAKI